MFSHFISRISAFSIFFVVLSLALPFFVFAQVQGSSVTSEEVEAPEVVFSIHTFVRDDCKHCLDQEIFLAKLESERDINIVRYNLAEEENQVLFDEITDKYNIVKSTPLTLVRNKLIQGYGDEETTGKLIIRLLDEDDADFVSFVDIRDGGGILANDYVLGAGCEEECVIETPSYRVKIPLIGKYVDVGGFSLAAISLTLGFVDGFNPCALWVLIMFLLILSQIGSRRKMLQYAGIFIIAEAVMYYLILTVWFTAWDFIGLNRIVTPIVGLLALGSGIYFLYRFFTYSPVCKVVNSEQQQKLSDKVKQLASKPMSWAVFGGILFVAFSVNIFEFACSIGIPQTFTKILEINHLSWLSTQWYMFLYILMYMVDDVIVFGIALYSIEKIGVTHTYSKWANLIGGVLMVLLGLVMIFNPELLVF